MWEKSFLRQAPMARDAYHPCYPGFSPWQHHKESFGVSVLDWFTAIGEDPAPSRIIKKQTYDHTRFSQPNCSTKAFNLGGR